MAASGRMSDPSCVAAEPAAMRFKNPSNEQLKALLTASRTVAVVGCSPKAYRISHQITAAMQRRGYRIIPVHPDGGIILGETAYRDLSEVPEHERIDIVNVFRRSELTPPIAREAVRRRVRALWLQLGVYDEEAARIAAEGGIMCVMNACWSVVHTLVM